MTCLQRVVTRVDALGRPSSNIVLVRNATHGFGPKRSSRWSGSGRVAHWSTGSSCHLKWNTAASGDLGPAEGSWWWDSIFLSMQVMVLRMWWEYPDLCLLYRVALGRSTLLYQNELNQWFCTLVSYGMRRLAIPHWSCCPLEMVSISSGTTWWEEHHIGRISLRTMGAKLLSVPKTLRSSMNCSFKFEK